MALDPFPLLGGALWLDFVNTDRGRSSFPPDRLPDPDAFARWCELQHLAPDHEPDGRADAFTPDAFTSDAFAAASFARMLQLRARLTQLAETMHAGRHPPSGAISTLNELLARSSGCQQLTRVGGEWRLRFSPAHPLGALEAIARSAAATLAETRTAVRRCAGEDCSLFFADSSPTGSRRWCDASVCGGHALVERRRWSPR